MNFNLTRTHPSERNFSTAATLYMELIIVDLFACVRSNPVDLHAAFDSVEGCLRGLRA